MGNLLHDVTTTKSKEKLGQSIFHFSLLIAFTEREREKKINKWMVRKKEKSNETFAHRNLLTQPE